MGKRKWILGFLPVALFAVVYYNVSFLFNRSERIQPQVISKPGFDSPQPDTNMPQPNNVSFAEPAGVVRTRVSDEGLDGPSFVTKELVQRAHRPVGFGLQPAPTHPSWPQRNPFSSVRSTIAATSTRMGLENVASQPEQRLLEFEPSLNVSAILVQGTRRLAVVDGTPRQEGSLVGPWKIVSITPDSIQVETPAGTRVIGLSERKQNLPEELRSADSRVPQAGTNVSESETVR